MKIEVKRDYILVDGLKTETISLFSYTLNNTNKPSFIDLRNSYKLNKQEEVEFINRSGRNIYIVGLDDWRVELKSSQCIKAYYGIMKYMSQYKDKKMRFLG